MRKQAKHIAVTDPTWENCSNFIKKKKMQYLDNKNDNELNCFTSYLCFKILSNNIAQTINVMKK